MRKVLIVYGSNEGQTAKIAAELTDSFTKADCICEAFHGGNLPSGLDPAAYDVVVVGASIHLGRYQKYMSSFVKRHIDVLKSRPAAFFSVCLTAAGETAGEQEEVKGYIDRFCEETGWQPDLVGSFAGALRYSQYGFVKRFIMRRIATQTGKPTDTARDYEFTDWESVDAFARELLALTREVVPA